MGLAARNEPQIGFHWNLRVSADLSPLSSISSRTQAKEGFQRIHKKIPQKKSSDNMSRTLSARRDHSMGAGSSDNRPTIVKPIAKTRTLRTITANMTGTRFSAPGSP